MFKKVVAILLFISSANAALPSKEVSSLKSYQLIQLAKGYEAAQIKATDVYASAYDIRNLKNIKDFKKYAETLTSAELSEVVVTASNKEHLAYDVAKFLMTGDRYVQEDISGVGQLIQPLNSVILGRSEIKVFWGSSYEEEFSASHNVLVVFDLKSNEVLILTVGYSE